ncbi:MAG TPA: acyl-CoA thioesterase, partial [Tianweitania sediminis]|nr:acyl-CoA thioesterase [Tianweitania sediminis]
MTTIQAPESYPFHKTEGLRYSDTDRQGHVNNAVFATLLESGRVGIIYENGLSIAATGCAFVIARVEIDFRAELTWPGTVDVATAVTRIGRSSVELSQALFQNNRCAALSRSVVVQMNEA